MAEIRTETVSEMLTLGGSVDGTLLARRYRAVRQLGQGGMGSVWLVEDTQLDGKQFAVKMLPSILVSNKRAYKQLKDEALVSMRLTHPNIVTLRAFEENGGNPFLVMDYIDGQTLDDYLAEKGALSEAEAVRILRPIAAALDYAHGEGVVHRDIKPANVMIRRDGHPFVLDFGIAREMQETLTRVTGKLSSGTLLYMSPEQLHGAAPKKAQDVYSFAAMAYECLSGRPPFCRGQIEYQIDNDPPPPLPASLYTGASVMRGLAKKAVERPATCAAVLENRAVRFHAAPRPVAVPAAAMARNARVAHAVPPPPVSPRPPPPPPVRGEGRLGPAGKELIAIGLMLAAAGAIGLWMFLRTEPFSSERTPSSTVVNAGTTAAGGGANTPEDPKGTGPVEPPQPTPPQPQPPSQPTPPDPTEDQVIDIKNEAGKAKDRLNRISDDDGFRGRKNVLANDFEMAKRFYEAKQWGSAAAGYTNFVNACKSLESLSETRDSAKASRDAAAKARTSAKDAGAEQYAPDHWKQAEGLRAVAEKLLVGMSFESARSKFELASKQFRASAYEVEAAKRARAAKKIEANSKRSLAWQKALGAKNAGAMTYAPDTWNAATTNAWRRGDAALAGGDYDGACEAFDQAGELYVQAMREAETAKASVPARRQYRYEVTLLPYVTDENGVQQSVAAKCECRALSMESLFVGGRHEIVIGSDSESDIEGAIRVQLDYNGRKNRCWLTADNFRKKEERRVCMD